MSKRVAVVGAGFGGWRRHPAAERRHRHHPDRGPRQAGGRAYVWREAASLRRRSDGDHRSSCIDELFALSGRNRADYVELLPVSPFYRLLWPDGSRFDYVNDQAELDRQIAAKNPGDVEGYRRFLKFSERSTRRATVGWARAVPEDHDMLAPRRS